MRGRGLVVILCLSGLLGAGVARSAEGGGATRPQAAHPPASVTFPPALSRVVHTRVLHTRIRTVRNSNSRRIGRSLASLRPTWVSGLLRYARNQYPTNKEERAWDQVRAIVRSHSPTAQFDVVLNAEQYRTPAAIERQMHRMRLKLDPDGWFFDFFSTAFHSHPRMVRAAIRSAHDHGEWVGGNVFGIAARRPLPIRADYFAVQDAGIHLNLRAVRRLGAQRAVMYHLHNQPDDQRSGGCRFIERFGTPRRLAMIRRRAAQQLRYAFRMSYPTFYPERFRARPRGPGSFLYSYNAFRDPPVAREISELLDRYDYDPAT